MLLLVSPDRSAAIYGQFLRYARAQNAHLLIVNSAFSPFAGLELASYIAPEFLGRYSIVALYFSRPFGCALRVLFAPPFASQVPHLRLVNCGLARLRGTKIPPQIAPEFLGGVFYCCSFFTLPFGCALWAISALRLCVRRIKPSKIRKIVES